MAKVEKATPAMFEDIYPLLLDFNNPNLSKENWKLIFDYPWKSEEEGIGYVLVDDRKVVGFLGTLFSRRILGDREAKLCHTTSWIVKEQYRGESLRLMLPLLKLRDYTINAISLSPRAYAVVERLGFTVLDVNLKLLFPVPDAAFRKDSSVITSDSDRITSILDPLDLKIYKDHLQYNCGHLVVEDAGGYCYILFTAKRRKSVPYGHIHYISNREVFLRCLNRIKLHFLYAHRFVFLAVEERMIGTQPLPFSKVYRLKVPRMYKSEVLGREQIDNLYTELVILGI
jgi:hypothetical protein